uniref:Putative secreted protein n=1 Tax=Ixodes ricinus TaxID=34613 RepID=A0A6B0UPS8_IXORI
MPWAMAGVGASLANALHDPVLLAKWTAVVLLHPQRHAAVVERVVALSPHHDTVVLLVLGLTPQASIHHLNTANGARVAFNVPAPHRHSVPLLENKHFIRFLPVDLTIFLKVIFVCHFWRLKERGRL